MTIRTFNNITPAIADSAYVDEQACVIGDVTLGAHSSVWPMATIRGDIHTIKIGAYTNIQDGSILHVTHDSEYTPGGFPLTVGNYVTVGHNVILHACTIQDYCLIGMGAIVLDGAILEPETMLGAGCVVTGGKTLESGYLWLGQPAKKIRPLTDEEKQFLRYSAEHYTKLANQYLKNA